MVIHYQVHVIFKDTQQQLQENILHHFLHCSFFVKSLLNWEVSLIHLKLFTESFCDFAQPHKLFTTNIEDIMIPHFYDNLSCIYY